MNCKICGQESMPGAKLCADCRSARKRAFAATVTQPLLEAVGARRARGVGPPAEAPPIGGGDDPARRAQGQGRRGEPSRRHAVAPPRLGAYHPHRGRTGARRGRLRRAPHEGIRDRRGQARCAPAPPAPVRGGVPVAPAVAIPTAEQQRPRCRPCSETRRPRLVDRVPESPLTPRAEETACASTRGSSPGGDRITRGLMRVRRLSCRLRRHRATHAQAGRAGRPVAAIQRGDFRMRSGGLGDPPAL